MTTAVELKMPLNYVEMDAEEMEYLEGGAGIKRKTVALAIDVVAIIVSAGKSIATIRAAKAFLKANKNKVVYQVSGKLMKMFGTGSRAMIGAAVDTALTLCEFSSLGGLIAAGIDYVDGKYNGYCFG